MRRDYSKYINRPGYQVPLGYDPNRYPRQSATTDIVIFSFFEKKLQVLLIRRKKMPFQGYWAIPGGFVENEEDLPESAKRELFEETGLKNLKLYEFGAFGHPKRDPRTRTITIAYLALVRKDQIKPRAGDDAEDYAWFPARTPPELAFDHELVLKSALNRLQELVILKPVLFDLLPKTFSPEQLSQLCQQIFRKKYQPVWLCHQLQRLKLIKQITRDQYQGIRKNFPVGGLGFLIADKA